MISYWINSSSISCVYLFSISRTFFFGPTRSLFLLLVLFFPRNFLLSWFDKVEKSRLPLPPSQKFVRRGPNEKPHFVHVLFVIACSEEHAPHTIRVAHTPTELQSLEFSWQISQGYNFLQQGKRNQRNDLR